MQRQVLRLAVVLGLSSLAVFAQRGRGSSSGGSIGPAAAVPARPTPSTPAGPTPRLVSPPPNLFAPYYGVPRGPRGPMVVGSLAPWGGWVMAPPLPPPIVVQQQVFAPSFVVNQNFVPERLNPVVREFPEGSLPAPAAELRTFAAPPVPAFPDPKKAPQDPDAKTSAAPAASSSVVYLIAFTDGNVILAESFLVQDGVLQFTTKAGVKSRASLDLIDRAMTERLNRERGLAVEFGK